MHSEASAFRYMVDIWIHWYMIENENWRPLPKTPKFTFHASEFQENLVISFPLNSTPGNSTKVTKFPLLRFHISPYPISLNQNNNAAYFRILPEFRIFFGEIKESYCFEISPPCIILLASPVTMHVFKSCRQRRFSSTYNLNTTKSKSDFKNCVIFFILF